MTIVKIIFDDEYFEKCHISIEYDDLKNLDALGKDVKFEGRVVGRVIQSEFDTNRRGLVLTMEITDAELKKKFE